MNTIWQRYFFKELAWVLLLFLSVFYILYVLIDYSAHSKAFSHEHVSLHKVFFYYILQFSKRADILLPVALILANIKVLSASNTRGELIALATGGISLIRILSPFLKIACLCCAFCYLNLQLIIPSSLSIIDDFEKTYFHSKNKGHEGVNYLLLEDNSLLFYQTYDATKKFVDVYWFISTDELYRMLTLDPHASPPVGQCVDHLIRTSSNELVIESSSALLTFPHMQLSMRKVNQSILPLENQSLTSLADKVAIKGNFLTLKKMTNREAKTATWLYYKLFMPLACFISILGPAAYLLRFGRHLPIFWIFAFSLCGIFAYFTLMSALRILAEGQLFPPLLAMLFTPMLFLSFSFYKIAKGKFK